VYLDPDDLSIPAVATKIGFEQTVIGLVAFLCGVIVMRCFARRHGGVTSARHESDCSNQNLARVEKLARYYLWTGGVAYFVGPLVSAIPSAGAVFSSLVVPHQKKR